MSIPPAHADNAALHVCTCTYSPSAARVLTHVTSPELLDCRARDETGNQTMQNCSLLQSKINSVTVMRVAIIQRSEDYKNAQRYANGLQAAAIHWQCHGCIISFSRSSLHRRKDMPSASYLCRGRSAPFVLRSVLHGDCNIQICAFSDFAMACLLLCLWLWARSDK